MTSLEKIPQGAVVGEHRFGATTVAKGTETAAVAVAARARAAVEARFIMAERNPRDLAEARARVLADCARPAFAAAAWYKIPNRGEGFTIRFAESAIRAMRNIAVDATVVYDDDDMRTIRVEVTDLEANVTFAVDASVKKTIERKSLRDGQVSLGTRTTSTGGIVYLTAASDDELLVKQAAIVSKALRTQGLRHIPGDILQEAKGRIAATRAGELTADPETARKKLVDAFATLNVSVAMIRRYVGIGKLEEIDVNKFEDLRGIYGAMQDGMSWADATGGDEPAGPKIPNGKGVSGLAAKVDAVVGDAKPVDYTVVPEIPTGGPTDHGLIRRADELMGEAGVDWNECAQWLAKKVLHGAVPEGLTDLPVEALVKLNEWLELAAEAQKRRDEQEGGA